MESTVGHYCALTGSLSLLPLGIPVQDFESPMQRGLSCPCFESDGHLYEVKASCLRPFAFPGLGFAEDFYDIVKQYILVPTDSCPLNFRALHYCSNSVLECRTQDLDGMLSVKTTKSSFPFSKLSLDSSHSYVLELKKLHLDLSADILLGFSVSADVEYGVFFKSGNGLENEVNDIRAERLARTANPLVFVAQQQLVYHPQNHPNHYTQNSLTRSQQAATRNRGTQVVQKSRIRCYNCKKYGHVLRECQKPKRAKNAAYHKEKMLLYQELEAHYMYMVQIQEVTPDAADNSGPIFDAEPLQKVQNNDDNYNVFAIESEYPEQPDSINNTYLEEQGDTTITIDSLDMSTNGETVDQDDDDDDDDLAKECDLLASLIEKLKCEIDDNKNRNKVLETSNKALVDKLKGLIDDFENKN
ncbi:ribonuclease H-like domain-containing protein, partial [Tanacetum coccineum]